MNYQFEIKRYPNTQNLFSLRLFRDRYEEINIMCTYDFLIDNINRKLILDLSIINHNNFANLEKSKYIRLLLISMYVLNNITIDYFLDKIITDESRDILKNLVLSIYPEIKSNKENNDIDIDTLDKCFDKGKLISFLYMENRGLAFYLKTVVGNQMLNYDLKQSVHNEKFDPIKYAEILLEASFYKSTDEIFDYRNVFIEDDVSPKFDAFYNEFLSRLANHYEEYYLNIYHSNSNTTERLKLLKERLSSFSKKLLISLVKYPRANISDTELYQDAFVDDLGIHISLLDRKSVRDLFAYLCYLVNIDVDVERRFPNDTSIVDTVTSHVPVLYNNLNYCENKLLFHGINLLFVYQELRNKNINEGSRILDLLFKYNKMSSLNSGKEESLKRINEILGMEFCYGTKYYMTPFFIERMSSNFVNAGNTCIEKIEV